MELGKRVMIATEDLHGKGLNILRNDEGIPTPIVEEEHPLDIVFFSLQRACIHWADKLRV